MKHELGLYEREHGDKSSTWWPWSKPNRIVAQERAADIISKFKTIENPKLDRSARSFSKADQLTQALVKLVDKAHDGDSISMYDLGIAYLRGLDGFPKNPEAAREWFRLSSARGFVPGMYNYAICLTEAVGGPGDANGAVRLFRLGAMRDDPLSQHNLGSSYGNGRGVARDYVEAAAWWILCESKVPQAKTNLANLVASSGSGFMAKAKARSEVLRNEITLNFFRLKKDLIW
jgi:TPR repeat protein